MSQMNIPVWCVGISHRTAPVELIERISSKSDGRETGFDKLRARFDRHFPDREVVLLSTCNRVELYWTHGMLPYGGRPEEAPGDCPYEGFTTEELEELFEIPARPTDDAPPPIFQLRGHAACRHLFEVAAGLDSLVIGEYQILGQLGDALDGALKEGSAGPVLQSLFRSAIRAGRRVRSETAIGRNASSVSSVAVDLAERVLGSLRDRRVLVAGAGEVGRLTLAALHSRGALRIDLLNRSLANAQESAVHWGDRAFPLESLPDLLVDADILISSTGSQTPILGLPDARKVMAARAGRPLVIIDIAMPRDIAPAAAGLPGLHLYDMEALGRLVDETAAARRAEIPQANAIIAEELDALTREMGELSVRPLLAGMWGRANEIRSELLESARQKNHDLDEAQWHRVEELSQLLVNKILHDPAARLREAAGRDGAFEHARSIAYLFGLPQADGAAHADGATQADGDSRAESTGAGAGKDRAEGSQG